MKVELTKEWCMNMANQEEAGQLRAEAEALGVRLPDGNDPDDYSITIGLKLNDEGPSNAARWHQRATEAEAEVERLTELADSEGTRAVNYLRRARKAEKVLRELVALEDMRLRLRQLHEMGHGTDYADYHRLLLLAWDEARLVLGPNARLSGAGTASA